MIKKFLVLTTIFTAVYLLLGYILKTNNNSVQAQSTVAGIIAATGQSSALQANVNVPSMAQSAALEAKNSFTAKGGTTPKIVIVIQNTTDPSGAIVNAIRQQFGANVPIAGVEIEWADYSPYTVKEFPSSSDIKSIAIMAIGGDAINVQTATGAGNFASNTSSEALLAGQRLGQQLAPVAGKKNLLLLLGPMHTPLNQSVVSGIKSAWGNPLPSNTKIIGWGGSYWGTPVYNNGTKTAQGSAILGVMISGDYEWAAKGKYHGFDWENNPQTFVTNEISGMIDDVKTQLNGNPDATFVVLGHPSRNYFSAIRDTFSQKMGNSAAIIGHHAGAEVGHDLTSGDVIADSDHFFMIGIKGNTTSTSTPTASPTATATASPINLCKIDINQDGIIDLSDYILVATNFFKTSFSNPRIDITADGIIDLSDYSQIAINFLKPATGCQTSTQSPTATPIASTGEWTQFGHNAQRTNYTSQYVPTPWKYKWQWNGAGPDGKKQAGHLSVPDLVQPVTGNGKVYMVANNQVFALNQADGTVAWSTPNLGTLTATPAYSNGYLYVPSGDGNLYKLDSGTGAINRSFNAGTALTLAALEAGGSIYVVGANGTLYKVNASTMDKTWDYPGGSPGVTPASYSPSRQAIIFVTQDLYVHSVKDSNGSRNWREKPTPRTYTIADTANNLTEALEGWPVIAEQHGLVFIRYRLEWNTLWTWNPYPTTNAAIRANLTSQPNQQALFALSLDTGKPSFVPAVGNGGAGDGGRLPMGPQPVIRTVNGAEVAYIIWRNGLTCAGGWCDGREDAAMGEMVLDSNTVTGYSAGDVRFVRFTDIQTDEMMNITMSGDIIFHSHWLINSAEKVTDRGDTRGATFTNPIVTVDAPFVIWRQVYCPTTNPNCNPQIFPGGSGTSWGPSNCPFNATTRYCSAGLYSYGDQRGYPAGFYEYHNDENRGSTPFTVVSNNLVLVKTNDGAVMAFQNGNPIADAGAQPLVGKTASFDESPVLSLKSEISVISYKDAKNFVGKQVIARGEIASVVNHRPKAIYLGFKDPHDGELLVRIFEKDINKFPYDIFTLIDKEIEVSGFVSLYWPDLVDPEIIITDPSQIKIIQ